MSNVEIERKNIEKNSYVDSLKIKSKKGILFHLIFPLFLIFLTIIAPQSNNEFLYYLMITTFELLLSSGLIGLYILEEKLNLKPKSQKTVEVISRLIAFLIVIIFFIYFFKNIEY